MCFLPRFAFRRAIPFGRGCFGVHEGCPVTERMASCVGSFHGRLQNARGAPQQRGCRPLAESAMTKSTSREVRQPETSPAHGGGFRLRLFMAIAAPALVLGVAGAYLATSLAPKPGAPLPIQDFLSAYVAAAGLALALAGVLAYAVDFALRRHLGLLERSLRSGRMADLMGLAGGREWAGLRTLARASQDALSRAEENRREAEELKTLQGAADDLLDKIRDWAESEIAPPLGAEGPLAELVGALRVLSDHLDDRAREAREVTELARESLVEACEAVERAGQEAGRGAREVSALLTALAEVRRLSGELASGLRVWRDEGHQETSEPVLGPADGQAGAVDSERERFAAALARSKAILESLEVTERRALRAALDVAARSLAERRPQEVWLGVVEELRSTILGCRSAAVELEALARDWTEALETAGEAETAAPLAPAPFQPATNPVERLAAVAERLQQWAGDGVSRGDRLAALAQRASGDMSAALAASRNGVEELSGLASRFETRTEPGGEAGRASATESGGPSAPENPGAPGSWLPGSRPLRLLTRNDVIPEDDGEDAPDRGRPPGG
jgi:hypothetical protein